jgi:aerobic carbon-monoxide dehydrogenase medium subunit
MFPASFAYFAPSSLEQALELLTRHGEDAKLLAGGHSLIPAMKLRLSEPACLIDLGRLPDLHGVRLDGNVLVIGAMTVHADIAASDLVRQYVPGLAEAAGVIGDVQVRNRGTIGGSVAHADPGADLPVMLTALNAFFVLVGPSRTRTVAADDFFEDFFTTALAPEEVLTEVRIPLPPPGAGSAYAKLPHPASGYVVVSAGVLVVRGADGACVAARVSIGGVAGGPHRATATESALLGKPLTSQTIAAAAALAADGSDPDEDMYASAEYRRHLATVYARRAIEASVQRIGA